MQPYVVLPEHLGHQAVDAAAHVGQQHQYVHAVVACGQPAFNRVHLTADALDA